jgi:hypothetical protein
VAAEVVCQTDEALAHDEGFPFAVVIEPRQFEIGQRSFEVRAPQLRSVAPLKLHSLYY